MIRLRLLVFLILAGQSLIANGQTQVEMTDASNIRLKNAEAELKTVYEKIRVQYKEDTEFVKNLRESQELWIKWRTAELKAKFPDRQPGYYGSVQPMCAADYLADLTNERITRI